MFSPRQHHLRPLDAPVGMVAMRRNAERLLERPAKVKGAQSSPPRQRGKRNLLGKMFLDIGGHDPLLPGGQATPYGRVSARRSAIEANEFVNQNDAKSFDIEPARACRCLERLSELCCRAPDRSVLEEQARHQRQVLFAIDL